MIYYTIQNETDSKLTEKGSKFLGFAYKIKSKADAGIQLESIRKKYYDATHHCFAWQTGFGNGLRYRYNDDGEPSGTAGLPIYQQITRRHLPDVLLITVRYFGGTKLGTGGLIRAYGESASQTLNSCGIRKMEIGNKIQFSCDYAQHPVILRILNQHHLIGINQDFAENVTLTAEVDETETDIIVKTVFNATSGSVKGNIVKNICD